MKWLHAAEVPDTEATMVKLVMSGKLAEHSREMLSKGLTASTEVNFDDVQLTVTLANSQISFRSSTHSRVRIPCL